VREVTRDLEPLSKTKDVTRFIADDDLPRSWRARA